LDGRPSVGGQTISSRYVTSHLGQLSLSSPRPGEGNRVPARVISAV